MRNRNKINQLGRTSSHREALMMNLANALITHKRISTTLAKAKALRGYVEPLITKSKNDTTHSRRLVFSQLQSKEAVTELFREVAPKIAERPGGYTRIIKTGFRSGDSAEMCMIELVDFNEIYTTESKPEAKKTRRSRRGTGTAAPKTETKAAPKAESAPIVEDAVEVKDAVEESKDEESKAPETESKADSEEKKEDDK
ncbi:MAG TPA: 50S ribosomal protein L17 [Flavobacteriales bacterium]|jgi:large subunit ribosomal protein L17|nr:50S ribosomal protein L17 [Flavobacteriales bacterium]